MKKWQSLATLIAFMSAWPSAAMAQMCIALSTGQGNAVVIVENREYLVQPKPPTIIRNCPALAVKDGNVCVMSGAAGNANPCSMLKSGDRISIQASDNHGVIGAIASIYSELKGDTSRRSGGKRAHSQEALVGLPYEYVLVPRGDLLIPAKLLSGQSVEDFRFENRSNRKGGSATLQNGRLRIPAAFIAPGAAMNWQARIAGKIHSGSFTFVSPADEPSLQNDLRRVAGSVPPGNPVAIALATAGVLADHGFQFDAENILFPILTPGNVQ